MIRRTLRWATAQRSPPAAAALPAVYLVGGWVGGGAWWWWRRGGGGAGAFKQQFHIHLHSRVCLVDEKQDCFAKPTPSHIPIRSSDASNGLCQYLGGDNDADDVRSASSSSSHPLQCLRVVANCPSIAAAPLTSASSVYTAAVAVAVVVVVVVDVFLAKVGSGGVDARQCVVAGQGGGGA